MKFDNLCLEIEDLNYRLQNGCGSEGCLIKKRVVKLHFPCRCQPNIILKELSNIVKRIEKEGIQDYPLEEEENSDKKEIQLLLF